MNTVTTNRRRLRRSFVMGAACAALSTAFAPAAAIAQTNVVRVHLGVQPLGRSLEALARQSGIDILFTPAAVAGRTAPAIDGTMAPHAAVERLIAGTGLMVRQQPNGALIVAATVETAAPQTAATTPDDETREIVVTATPDDNDALESVLSEIRGRGRVQIHTAQRGEKANLMQTATLNAQQSLMLYKTRRSADFATRSTALADIQEALGMSDAPLRMECYDVSHLSGTNIVASMVVFEDGLPRKDQYRRFNIPQSTDDTESIYQTLSRRLSRLDDELAPVEEVGEQRKRFAYRPNLLIVDGGQPQVAAARRALDDAGVTDIALCGIAKRLEEIWLPDDDFPVILPRNSDALFLIQRIRDEAHRFAITHQRQRRKRDISTQLAEIPGLGPSRVAVLLKHFGSVKRLKEAEAADISAIRGIGPTLASAVVERLRGDEQVDVDDTAPPSGPA